MRKMVLMTMCLIAVLAVAIAPANAAIEENDKSDIYLYVYVPCAFNGAGDTLEMFGPLHTVISYTTNGNNFSGFYHSQPQGISGTSLTTGVKYQATGITRQSFKGSFQNFQYNSTYVNNFRMIGQGSADSYLVHETLHFTFNAKGVQTVYHDNFSVECK